MELQPSAPSTYVVRRAEAADLPAMADIYNEVVLKSTPTFDLEPSSAEQQGQWLSDHRPPYAALVAIDGTEVVGWAALSPFRSKPAYRFTVEDSLYVRAGYEGKGIGALLLARLLDLAARNGFHSVIARITGDNPTSLRLHRRLGFRRVGMEREVGYKFDRWVDVVIMQFSLLRSPMSRLVGTRVSGQDKWRWSLLDQDGTLLPMRLRSRAGEGLSRLALLTARGFSACVARGKAGRLGMSSATSRVEAAVWPGLSRFSVAVLPAYVAAIVTAEIVTALIDARWGVGLHVAILWSLLVHFSWAKERSEAKLLLALCLAPLIRILSLGMPLEDVGLVYWFLIVGAPTIVAALLVARTLGLTRYDLGLRIRAIPVQLLVGAMGVGFGISEYFILKPDALVDELTWQQAWWPALILLVATGFGEELVFRGVMQSASTDALGKAAIPCVALVFTALHVGYKSAPGVAFVFLVALFFGWVVARTGSLLGVTLAHGIANIVLYLIAPFTAIAVS